MFLKGFGAEKVEDPFVQLRKIRLEITVLCPFASEFDKDMALQAIWFQKVRVMERERIEFLSTWRQSVWLHA